MDKRFFSEAVCENSQEITLYAWPKIYGKDNKFNLDSRAVLSTFREWGKEFEGWWRTHGQDWIDEHDYIEEIELFAAKKVKRHLEYLVEESIPRVHIKYLVSEDGHPVEGEIDFPKRGENMNDEYEWYYSLKEVQPQIMALPVGGSMNFKIRDDEKSHGVVIRLA